MYLVICLPLLLDHLKSHLFDLVSSDLGFGLMDAKLMVKYAKKWNSVPEQLLCIVNLGTSK